MSSSPLLSSPPSPVSGNTAWSSRTSTANGRTRLWFRRLLRLFGLDPGTVAHKFDALKNPLSTDDIEQLKKMFVPLSALVSLAFLLLGPILFPNVFGALCTAFFSFIALVHYSHLTRYIAVFHKLKRVASDYESNAISKVQFNHIHTIIIPNYQEPISLLRATLTQLAQHPCSKTNYVVVLAMEAAEGTEGDVKSKRLSADFKGAFHSMVTTVHPVGIPGECRGKGANVAWAVQQVDVHMQNDLRTVDAHRVILTIVDADAGLSELYFNELEREMVVHPTHEAVPLVDPQYRLFCPPIFFARNSHRVPAIVRATDVLWSIALMQNLGSPNQIHFPCSSYSVTLSLARHVGGWDTSADAIGEDMHMFLKCFYLSHGLARATPIFVPVNLTNVQASTYTGSMTARYTQARRHFAGSADSLFAMRHAFWPHKMDLPSPIPTRAQPAGHLVIPKTIASSDALEIEEEEGRVVVNYASYFWDRIFCLLHVFEAHLVPSTSWITMLALPLTALLNPALAASWSFSIYIQTLSIFMLVPYVVMFVLYERLHRFLARSELLGPYSEIKETRSWYHVFDFLLLPICAFLYVAVPATSHCDNALRILVLRQHAKQFTYIVAEKGVADVADPQPIPYVPMPNVPLPSHASSSAADCRHEGDLMGILVDSGVCPLKELPVVPPPDFASHVEGSPPSPASATSHALQAVASHSWRLKQQGHAKHLSTDSGFCDMEVSARKPGEPKSPLSLSVLVDPMGLMHL